jgi:ribosomal-protein-alanine acetyltransferase
VDGRVSGGRKHAPQVNIAIRPAEPADADALLVIEEAVFPTDRLDRRAFRHAARSPTMICLVAQAGGAVIGYAIAERRRSSTAARLTSIAVAPKAAGAGIGKRLLAAIEKRAAAAGSARIRLEVREDNRAARNLYETTGYRLVETLQNYYEDGAAAHRYEKTLGPR